MTLTVSLSGCFSELINYSYFYHQTAPETHPGVTQHNQPSIIQQDNIPTAFPAPFFSVCWHILTPNLASKQAWVVFNNLKQNAKAQARVALPEMKDVLQESGCRCGCKCLCELIGRRGGGGGGEGSSGQYVPCQS